MIAADLPAPSETRVISVTDMYGYKLHCDFNGVSLAAHNSHKTGLKKVHCRLPEVGEGKG